MFNAKRHIASLSINGSGARAVSSRLMQFRLPFMLALILFAAVITGCASTPHQEDRSAPRKLLWPPPPASAKIQYMSMITQSQDVGARDGFFARLADVLLGEKIEPIVKPYGLTADGTGRLIVADTGLKRVHIFDIKGKDYYFIDEAG